MHWMDRVEKHLNPLQKYLFDYVKGFKGKSVTAEKICAINDYRENLTVRRIKYNLTLMRYMNIGIDEEYKTINKGNSYSCGYYFDEKLIYQ